MERRFSKYLLYAIGEIILVVVGILIALSINSWNEDRLDKKEVAIYLDQIRKELAFDIDVYQDDLDHINKAIDYLHKVDEGRYGEVDLSILLTYLARNMAPVDNDKSYTKLVQSGKLELSDNSQVNAQLQDYYVGAYAHLNQASFFHQRFVSENIEGPVMSILGHKKDFGVDPSQVIEKMEVGSLRSMVNWQSSFLANARPSVEKNIAQAQALIELLDETRREVQ